MSLLIGTPNIRFPLGSVPKGRGTPFYTAFLLSVSKSLYSKTPQQGSHIFESFRMSVFKAVKARQKPCTLLEMSDYLFGICRISKCRPQPFRACIKGKPIFRFSVGLE